MKGEIKLSHHISTFLSTSSACICTLLAHIHVVSHLITFSSTCFTNISTHFTHLFYIFTASTHHHRGHSAHIRTVSAHHHTSCHIHVHHLLLIVTRRRRHHCHTFSTTSFACHHTFITAFNTCRVLLIF